MNKINKIINGVYRLSVYCSIIIFILSFLTLDTLNVNAANNMNNQLSDTVSENSLVLNDAQQDKLRGYWEGQFYATSGNIMLNMDIRFKIVSVKADGTVQGYFYFIGSADSTVSPYGCYSMLGKYDPETANLKMDGDKWIVNPDNYPFISMDATVDLNGSSIKGYAKYNGNNYNGLTLKKTGDLAVDNDVYSDIAMQEYLKDFANNGYGSIADTIKVDYVKKKYYINPVIGSEWNVLTLNVGNKVRINNYYDKRTFKSTNKNIASVSATGVIKAKKPGQIIVTYKSNGMPQTLNIIVKKPVLERKDNDTIIKGSNATVIAGENFDVVLNVPLNTVLIKTINKDVVEGLTVKLDKDGNYCISGQALKKGKVKMQFAVNGKKIYVYIKCKKS